MEDQTVQLVVSPKSGDAAGLIMKVIIMLIVMICLITMMLEMISLITMVTMKNMMIMFVESASCQPEVRRCRRSYDENGDNQVDDDDQFDRDGDNEKHDDH